MYDNAGSRPRILGEPLAVNVEEKVALVRVVADTEGVAVAVVVAGAETEVESQEGWTAAVVRKVQEIRVDLGALVVVKALAAREAVLGVVATAVGGLAKMNLHSTIICD